MVNKGRSYYTTYIMNISIFGSTGYLGSEFMKQIKERGWSCFPHSHKLNRHEVERALVRDGADLCIIAAAFIPKPSVSACDDHLEETIRGNVLFPEMVSRACEEWEICCATISTCCLWSDDLMHSETDPPQRGFGGYCGTYIGTKLLCEKLVAENPKHYIWRVRLPFDQFDNDRNYLTKLATYAEVWDQNNSCSHRGDFVKACLDLWKLRAPFGVYNCTNPGYLNSATVLWEMQRRGMVEDHEPVILGGRTEGQCRVSVKKLQDAGVKIRPVEEALEESLKNWIPRI